MVANQPTYVTPQGLKKLQDEIDYLCTIKRAEMADLLNDTQSGGDHIDNTEYQSAYYDHILLENRISELKRLLASAMLIEPSAPTGEVRLGSTVVIQDEEQQLETYLIVGPLEANPSEGRISDECPLGQVLLNHRVGESVDVLAPDGVIHYRLIAVS